MVITINIVSHSLIQYSAELGCHPFTEHFGWSSVTWFRTDTVFLTASELGRNDASEKEAARDTMKAIDSTVRLAT